MRYLRVCLRPSSRRSRRWYSTRNSLRRYPRRLGMPTMRSFKRRLLSSWRVIFKILKLIIYGRYVAFCHVPFLFFIVICSVIVACLNCFGNPSAILSQSVSNIIAIRLQRNGRPSAAVGSRFTVPAYMNVPTKWGTEMCVHWNEYTYLIIWKHVCGEMDICIW